jgi:hypothetical protein
VAAAATVWQLPISPKIQQLEWKEQQQQQPGPHSNSITGITNTSSNRKPITNNKDYNNNKDNSSSSNKNISITLPQQKLRMAPQAVLTQPPQQQQEQQQL